MLARISAGFGFALGVVLAFALVSFIFNLALEIFYAVLRLVGLVFCAWFMITIVACLIF